MALFFLIAYIVLLGGVVVCCKLWNFRWDIKNYAILFFILFYIIVPIIYWLNITIHGYMETMYLYEKMPVIHMYAYVIILISSIILVTYKPKRQVLCYLLRRKRLSCILLVLLLISAISTYLFIKGQGGFSEALKNTIAIRAGVYIDENGHQSFLFYKRFIPLSLLVYFFSYLLPNKSTMEKIVQIVAALIVMLNLFFLQGSRQGLIDFIMVHILVPLIKTNKIINLRLICFFVCIVILIPILKYYLSGGYALDNNEIGSNTSSRISYFDEFSFAYFSLINAISYGSDFNLFSDFVEGLYSSFLPMSWCPVGLEGSNKLNTFLVTGYYGGSVPPGLIGQGYYSLGFLGVLVVMFCTTYVFNRLTILCQCIRKNIPGFVYVSVYIMLYGMAWIRTGLPRNFFYSPNFVLFILIICCCLKRKRNEDSNS